MSTVVLSIAGSDPSGGAGIQADLKTFAAHEVYGCAALTALTAQNTTGVGGVVPCAPGFVTEQVRMVLADLPVAAIKLGMMANAGIVRAVAEALEGFEGPVVLDPVMVSTSGHRLLAPEAEAALVRRLVPLATIVTPNIPEQAILLGDQSPEAWVAARPGVALLLKDGHNTQDIVRDRLLGAGLDRVFAHPRIDTRNTHGTGCTLSSAIAARLGRGDGLEVAVAGAVDWLAQLIQRSADHDLGSGAGPLLHG